MINTATNGLSFDCFNKSLNIEKVDSLDKEDNDKGDFTEVDSPTKNLIIRTSDPNVEIE